ncbi:MAG: phosphoribosylglycinamide formyltransferase [Planctomycetes bacterium]|nr:phosphoribosylglycinamide formyltransferase [Planctomycetota bacterium]
MSPVRIGVLFSGGGRTLENLASKVREGSLPAEIHISLSSHPEAGGIERARRLEVPCKVLDYRQHGEALSDRITEELDAAGVDLVLLAGFIRLYRFPPRYEGRIMNIHPALLPAFGGKGFYGDRVHEAVLRSGAKFSGCTVHFVSAEYDEGPIILQRVVPVRPGDTVHDLAERVFAEECIAYPEAVRLYAEGRLRVREGRVEILGSLLRADEAVVPPHPVRE